MFQTAEESLDAEDKKVELNKQINSFAHRFACISSKLKSIELFTAEINAKNDQILADRDQIDQLIKSNISENFIKLDDVAPLESSILAMENRLKLMKLANFDSLEQLNAQRQCLIALENRLEELMLEEKQSGLKQKVELSHQLTIAKLRLSEKLRQLQSLNDDLKTEQIIGHLDCLDRQSRDQFDNQRKAYEGLESESSQLYSELRRISVDLEDLRKRNEPNASVEHLQNDNLSAQHEESDIMPVSKAITTMDATTNTEENVLGDSLLLTLAQLKAEVRQNKLTSLKRQLIIRQALMTTKCRMNMEKKTMLKEMREKSAFLLISMASLLEGQRKLNPKKIDQITKAAKQYF